MDTNCIDMLWKVKLLEVIGIHEKFDNLCRVFSYCIKRLSSKQRIFNIAFSSCCWLMGVSMHRLNFFDVANTIISQTQCITNFKLKMRYLFLLNSPTYFMKWVDIYNITSMKNLIFNEVLIGHGKINSYDDIGGFLYNVW